MTEGRVSDFLFIANDACCKKIYLFMQKLLHTTQVRKLFTALCKLVSCNVVAQNGAKRQ